jgi:hypothetical protein
VLRYWQPMSSTGRCLLPPPGVFTVSVATGGFTVNTAALVVTPLVVTVTFAAPTVALAAMVNVAVICVALATVTLPTVIPGLLTETVAPETKFVPVRVTGTLVP